MKKESYTKITNFGETEEITVKYDDGERIFHLNGNEYMCISENKKSLDGHLIFHEITIKEILKPEIVEVRVTL